MAYHITEDGPKRCTAKPGNCPVSGPQEHHSAKEDAESVYYASLAKANGTFPPRSGEVDLPCAFGNMRVKDGDLSDLRSRTALISGLCGSLALAVHDKTGGTPYFVCYDMGEGKNLSDAYAEGGESALHASATHALVESTTKPGTFIDAYGQKTIDDLKEFYGDDITLEVGSRAMLVNYADEGVPEILTNFADEAIAMDVREQSYSYMEFTMETDDEWLD
jgi:hypothetical protein